MGHGQWQARIFGAPPTRAASAIVSTKDFSHKTYLPAEKMSVI